MANAKRRLLDRVSKDGTISRKEYDRLRAAGISKSRIENYASKNNTTIRQAKQRTSTYSSGGSTSGISSWTSQNSGNQTVSAAANDLYFNAASANLQTKSDVNYAKQMMPLSLEYQRGAQSIATEADLRRMSAEGAITRDLVAQQGKINTGIQNIRSNADMYGYDRQLDGTRYTADRNLDMTNVRARADMYGYDRQLDGTRYTADRGVDVARIGADAQKYGYDRQYQASNYRADRDLDIAGVRADADKYGYDQQLTGVRDTNRSAEDQIRIRGGEDRETMIQGTNEALRLRADARGAIRSAGRTFYG